MDGELTENSPTVRSRDTMISTGPASCPFSGPFASSFGAFAALALGRQSSSSTLDLEKQPPMVTPQR